MSTLYRLGIYLAAALTLTSCALAPPVPRGWTRVGSLLYCYGEQQGIRPGQTWVDDACRIDPCELRMPQPDCVGFGQPLEKE